VLERRGSDRCGKFEGRVDEEEVLKFEMVDKVYLTESGIERAVGGMTAHIAGKHERAWLRAMSFEYGEYVDRTKRPLKTSHGFCPQD